MPPLSWLTVAGFCNCHLAIATRNRSNLVNCNFEPFVQNLVVLNRVHDRNDSFALRFVDVISNRSDCESKS